MKQLNPDGSITIPSNIPGTKRGPDSRGIRICFSELGRSCSLMQGYLIFTDGSAYVYDAPSNSDIEALCDSFTRGRTFNFHVRRSRGGFVRGFVPPADYETIYSFPPYGGVQPAACSLPRPIWANLFWQVTNDATPPGATTVFTPDPGNSDTAEQDFTRTSLGLSSSATMEADLTYAGGSSPGNLHFEIVDPTGVLRSNWTIDVSNGGSSIMHSASFHDGNFSVDFPFTVPDEAGTPTNIHVLFQWEPHSGGNVTDYTAAVTLSNV